MMTESPVPSLLRRDFCRLCHGRSMDMVLPLGPSPIADAYRPIERLGEFQGTYPLDLYLCHSCGHVQHLDIVDPHILFGDYTYLTSSSVGLVDHYRHYAEDVSQRYGLAPGALVVDIGSNDGSLLGFFKTRGLNVLGVDPAERIARDATARGIPTLPEFFNSQLADRIRTEFGSATVVTANNVFAHADDLEDMALGVRAILNDEGVFIFEVSYLPDIIDRFLFDTVYHEHVSYHSLAPLAAFFDRIGMQVFDVRRSNSKGGSIRVHVQRRSSKARPISPVIGEMIAEEKRRQMGKPEVFRQFGAAITQRRSRLLDFMHSERRLGKTFAGYGASTTVTTLMWHFGLTSLLDFLADDNPLKQGLFAPKCHIPVLPSAELYVRRPDYVVILAWLYSAPILKRHQRYVDEGGAFVIPLPELAVLDSCNVNPPNSLPPHIDYGSNPCS